MQWLCDSGSNRDQILGHDAKIVTAERPSSIMASKISATLLPIVLLPLGVLGVPLGEHGVPQGILAAGRERQELLQEKVCYYQVPQ